MKDWLDQIGLGCICRGIILITLNDMRSPNLLWVGAPSGRNVVKKGNLTAFKVALQKSSKCQPRHPTSWTDQLPSSGVR